MLRPIACAFGLVFSCGALALGACGSRDSAASLDDAGGAIAPSPSPSDAPLPDGTTPPACEADRTGQPGADPTLLAVNAIDVMRNWRFAVDPNGVGQTDGWASASFDDAQWRSIDAGKSWEAQGVVHDGLAWYRRHIQVPASWKGAQHHARLIASGIDDEYDVFVNGTLVRHHGSPGHSVWNRQTETEIGAALVVGDNVLAIRVHDWGDNGGIVRKLLVRHDPPRAEFAESLPEPVLPAHQDWVDLYWRAWEIAFSKIAFGTLDNGFALAYIDEGFNEQVYQWDSSFMALFARYGLRVFPAMGALDNFYSKQRADGYIQRVYSETDGKELGVPSGDEPMVNPPLFAWVELEYYRFSGDRTRLARVYPKLAEYWRWLRSNVRAPEGKGLYYQTDLGSGMDNTPRGDVHRAAWVDMSAQQALAARSLANIAEVLGMTAEATAWKGEHAAIAAQMDALLWSEADGFYYDLRRSGELAQVKHIGAFWTLLAGVASPGRAARLVAHLRDPAEFARPHPFPSLAANDPSYASTGHYWRGGVWAPTNYMVTRGLATVSEGTLAREAASSHIAAMAKVLASPPSDAARISPDERDGLYDTLWECYSAESASPGTRWDDTYLCRQDFVGWSGLGPIAMLFENVLGLEVIGAEQRIVWTMSRTDEHGVRRMPLGLDHVVDLVARPRASGGAPIVVDVHATRGFTLEIRRDDKPPRTIHVCAGVSTLTVE